MAEADQHLTILFVDISESSRLYRSLGDTRAAEVITDLFGSLVDVVAAHGGQLVDRIGDELMTTFPSVSNGLKTAVAMQWQTAEFAHAHLAENARLAVRVGLHAGPTVVKHGKPMGQAVYRAKRVVDAAKGHQVLIDSETSTQIENAQAWDIRSAGTIGLKGQDKPAQLMEVFWNTAESTALTHKAPQHADRPIAIILEVGNETFRVDEHQRLSLGRLPPCDVVVTQPVVSRIHAHIKSRKQGMCLEDVSSNGCYVLEEGEVAPNFLHKDEVVLRESGLIGLGRAPQPDMPHTIRYTCIYS